MKIEVDWETFHSRFYMEGMIYVREHVDAFEFYTCEGVMKIHCMKMKSGKDEENIMFVERYLTDKKNIIKVLEFEGYEELVPEEPEPMVEEPDFETKIEYKEKDE